MNIDLELYKVFYIVAKNKHMTKARRIAYFSTCNITVNKKT